MILTVSGWRGWVKRCNPAFVVHRLYFYETQYGSSLHVRYGDADGVDEIVAGWVKELAQRGTSITSQLYRADWGRYGRPVAGPIRNGQMLRGEHPDDVCQGELTEILLAFPEPGVKMRSPGSGTAGCLIEAHSLGISVDIPGYRGAKS